MEILLESYTVSIILFSLLILLILGSVLTATSKKIEKDKLTAITNNYKFLIGSIILVFITTIINKGLEERKLALEESSHLDKQIRRLKELTTGDEIENVEYFAELSRSISVRERWKNYLFTLRVREKKELEEIKKQDSIKEKVVKQKDKKVSEYNKTIISIDSLKIKKALKPEEEKILAVLNAKQTQQKKEIDSLKDINTKAKLKSYNISNDLKRPKSELFLNNNLICNSLLQPLDSLFKKTHIVYVEQYKANNFLYKDAKTLNNLNIEILKIMNTNESIIPESIFEDFKTIENYLQRWTSAFFELNSKKSYRPTEYFRVIYSGETFPSSSLAILRAELKNRCKQPKLKT